MKKITFMAALLAVFTMNAQIFSDSFEEYADFAISDIGEWTQIDVDGNTTYGSTAFTFDNESYVGTAIVFNPSLAIADPDDGTTAADTDTWPARTGDKGLYFFAATNDPNGTPLNDDYFISPQISLVGVSDASLSFWAKSLTENFGAERFEVLLSTSGTEIADFSENLSGGIITVSEGAYQELTYDLTSYDGEDIHIAIHYVGADSFVLLVDDFVVDGTLGVNDLSAFGFNYNVSNGEMRLSANEPLQNISIFNLLGQTVLNQKLSSTNENVNINALASGVYVAQATIAGKTESFKIIKR